MLKLNQTFKSILAPIKSKPILYRLAHGSFWALLGALISRMFSLISTIIIAKLLGVADFGAYGMVQSTIEMFSLLAGFGLGTTSSKYLAEYKVTDRSKAGRILSLTNTFAAISSSIIALAIYFSSSWIAGGILARSDLAPLLSMGAIYLFISTQNNVQIRTLGGFEAFKEIAKINSLQGILTPIFAIPLVYFYNLQGAVLSMIAISLVGYILCRFELNKKCRKFNIKLHRFSRSSFDEWPIIWHFSIPSLVSGLLVMPVIWLTNALLVNQQNGYSEMGLFNAANQWRQFIIFIPNILSNVLLPIFSDVYGNRSKEDFRSVFQLNLQLTWVIALPATILIVSLGDVLGDVFGAKYRGVGILIAPLMITAFFNIMNNVVGMAIVGAGRMWLGTAFNLCWAITMIICSVLLIPRYGSMGLAISYMVSYLFHTVWQMVYTEKVLIPQSLGKFKYIFLFTIFTIVPVYVLVVRKEINIYLSVVLVFIASIPLLQVSMNFYRRALSRQMSNG